MPTVDPASTAESIRDARSVGELEGADGAGLRGIVVGRVLGVEADLDGVPVRLAGLLAQLAAFGHGDLQRDEVDAR